MVNQQRKEKAKMYIKDLADHTSYWAEREGPDHEITCRFLARYVAAKRIYAMLTGEEYTGRSIYNGR